MSIDWSFLEQGYYVIDHNGEKTDTIRPELFDQAARQFGRFFAEQGKPSSSQLRAFYADAKALETKMRGTGTSVSKQAFGKHEFLVRMLKAKVAYVYGKETGKFVSKEFNDFITRCIDAIRDEGDFKAFMKLFESMVGFYYGRAGELEEERRQQRRRGRR
jgi:CRISPR type III-A-associated protein Csm2